MNFIKYLNYIDEAGDSFFYFIQLLNHWDVTLMDVMKNQKEKLESQSKINGRTFKK